MIARNVSTRHRVHPRSCSAERADLPEVVRADPSEAHNLAGLIADSFFLLRPSIWLVPEPDWRASVMRDYFEIAVEHAFHHGAVETLVDRSAVAVWFDYTQPIPEPSGYDQRRAEACDRWTERFVFLDGLLESHHPRDPHHHLAMIGVALNVQGTGRGTALLNHRHQELDAGGVSAYLEAASERLIAVYEKHGYLAGHPFYLAADGPPFYPMTRDPQQAVVRS
jgi:GNAT superfamily N-acetyltransferase